MDNFFCRFCRLMSKQALRNPSEHYSSDDQICFLFLTESRAPLSFFLREFHSDFQNSIVRKFSPDLHPSLMMAYHIQKREVPVQCRLKFREVCEASQNYQETLSHIFRQHSLRVLSFSAHVNNIRDLDNRGTTHRRWSTPAIQSLDISRENDYRIIPHDRPVSAGA